MATLTNNTVASTYTSLLKLDGNTDSTVAGASGNAIQVKTGDDEDTPLYLNTDRIGIETATPSSIFHVRGNVLFDHDLTTPVCVMNNGQGSTPNVLHLTMDNATPNDTTDWFIKFEDGDGIEGYVYSDGTHVALSDVRRKENIIDTPSQLGDVNKIRVINYNRKNDKSKNVHIGVIAQELEEIYPHLVSTADDEMKSKMVYKTGIFAILIKAVQELSAKVTALENA